MTSTAHPSNAFIALVLSLGICLPAYANHTGSQSHAVTPAPIKAAEVQDALRDLWIGHVFWVRNVVVETFAGNKLAAKAAEDEVVANARKIATSIEPFYGKAASDQLFQKLAGHYGAIKQYLDATVASSQIKQESAVVNLTANAGEIATFLSTANPNLPLETVRGLLIAHGAHHVQQIKQLQSKQYAQEAQTWAAITQHMYVISDALVGAIAKQFPDKFK